MVAAGCWEMFLSIVVRFVQIWLYDVALDVKPCKSLSYKN